MQNSKPAHAAAGVPAAAYYGKPVGGQRIATATATSRLATSYAPYVGRGLCAANDDTCMARPAKGTPYCAGHLRSIEKKAQEAANEPG